LRAYIALSASRRRFSGERVPSRSSTTPTGVSEGGPYALDEPVRVRLVVRRLHEDHELVAAEARDGIVRAHDAAKARRDLAQDLVADVVPEGVVDVLEVVEVDEGKDRRLGRGAGALERLDEGSAAEQLRQRVGRDLVREPSLALAHLLFDRVARREDPAHDPEHGGEHREADDGDHVRLVGRHHGRRDAGADGDLARGDTGDAPTEDETPVDAADLRHELNGAQRVGDGEHRSPSARVEDGGRGAGGDERPELHPQP
jgi:hypothetical protein